VHEIFEIEAIYFYPYSTVRGVTWKKITEMKMRLIKDALKATGRG